MKIIALILLLVPHLAYAHQYGIEKIDRIHALLESGRTETVEEIIRQEEGKNGNQARILLMRSHLDFYRGNYTASVYLLKEALSTDPGNQEIRNFLLFYTAVNENARDFTQKESGHFIVRTKGKDIILQDYTIECLEASYRALGALFKTSPSDKIIVEIFPTKEQFSLASTLSPEALERSGAIGICKFRRLMILSPRALLMGYRWMDALSHEFIHLLINSVSECNTPLWLHEGTARYFETRWRSGGGAHDDFLTRGTRVQLMKAVRNNTLIPFKRMHPSMVYLKNQEEVSLAFAEVASIVDFMETRYGTGTVVSILEGFARNRAEKVFKKVLKKNERNVVEEWKEHLKSLPETTAGGALPEQYVFDLSADEIEQFVGADAQGHVRLGDKFRKSGKFEVALIQYAKALELEPENAVILVKTARCLSAMGDYERMTEKLLSAVSNNPNYPTGFVLLADRYRTEGKYNEAVSLYREAAGINPFDPSVHKGMAQALKELHRHEEAVRALTIAAVLDPADVAVKNLLYQLSP